MNPMDRYADISDEELICQLREGDSAISDYLCNKYKNLVRVKAKSMYILGAEPEDLIQEGMIGLFKAVRDYDHGRDASFMTFAQLCISRQMYTAVQAADRKKHAPLNSYVSIYSEGNDNADGQGELAELIGESISNPEQMLIDKENVEQITKEIEDNLSKFEKDVLDLMLTGMDYIEISKVLGKSEKSIDNAIQRIRSKVKSIFLEKNRSTASEQ